MWKQNLTFQVKNNTNEINLCTKYDFFINFHSKNISQLSLQKRIKINNASNKFQSYIIIIITVLARIVINKYKKPQNIVKVAFACHICGADGSPRIQNTSNINLSLNYFKVFRWRIWSKPFHSPEWKKDLLTWMKTVRKSRTTILHPMGFIKAYLVTKNACIVHVFCQYTMGYRNELHHLWQIFATG